MKRLGLIGTIGLALAGGLGLLLATADDQELASVDLRHPTTLLAVVASRLHAVPSYVGALMEGATAGFRATVQQHERPKTSLER
jgi:hypothetical protein